MGMKLRRLKPLDIEEERELAGRLAGVLYLVGSLTGVLLLVLPGVEVSNPPALLAVCAIGFVWGAIAGLVLDWNKVPAVISHVSTGLGLPITAIVMGITGGAGSPALFYVFFVAVYCSWFYPPREAVPHLLGCAAVVTLPLLYDPQALAQGALAQAVIIIPTFAVLGWLIMGGKGLLVELRDRARELALRDPLTGLWNRRAFTDCLDESLGRKGGSVGLLLVDLDEFKAANTRYGYPAGDRVLCETAGVLSEVTRADDMVARLGGDEFAVLVKGAAEQGMERLAERTLSLVRAVGLEGLPGYRLSASAGWAVGCPGHETAEQLVSQADVALRGAKLGGKDRWQAQRPVEPHPAFS
jgi:diguanylate cyclase (GGDEF)-like protein